MRDAANVPLARAPLIAVDAMGYCWRVFPGEFWSMCPVNPDNSPIPRPLTFYMPTQLDENQVQLLLNYEKLEGGEQGAE